MTMLIYLVVEATELTDDELEAAATGGLLDDFNDEIDLDITLAMLQSNQPLPRPGEVVQMDVCAALDIDRWKVIGVEWWVLFEAKRQPLARVISPRIRLEPIRERVSNED